MFYKFYQIPCFFFQKILLRLKNTFRIIVTFFFNIKNLGHLCVIYWDIFEHSPWLTRRVESLRLLISYFLFSDFFFSSKNKLEIYIC